MDAEVLVLLIRVLIQTFIWVVIANSLLSFFLSPYHPVKEALERIVAPLLNPIRNLVPSAGGFDFSPLILILALDFISRVLIQIINP